MDPIWDAIGDIGELQASSLKLTVTPASENNKFIIGEWAEVRVTPTDIEFYSEFRLDISFNISYGILFSVWQLKLVK